MKYLNKVELEKHNYTRKELITMVKQRKTELNARLTNNQYLQETATYMLYDKTHWYKSKIVTNKSVESIKKADLINLFNNMTTVIKEDTQSTKYHEYVTKTDRDNLRKMNKTLSENGMTVLTMEQFQEYMKIKDTFPELFDRESTFYYGVVQGIKDTRKGHQRPLIELISESYARMGGDNSPYTKEDILRDALGSTNLYKYKR